MRRSTNCFPSLLAQVVDCPTQLIYIWVFFMFHNQIKKNTAGKSAIAQVSLCAAIWQPHHLQSLSSPATLVFVCRWFTVVIRTLTATTWVMRLTAGWSMSTPNNIRRFTILSTQVISVKDKPPPGLKSGMLSSIIVSIEIMRILNINEVQHGNWMEISFLGERNIWDPARGWDGVEGWKSEVSQPASFPVPEQSFRGRKRRLVDPDADFHEHGSPGEKQERQ